jgi:hypothetical protein
MGEFGRFARLPAAMKFWTIIILFCITIAAAAKAKSEIARIEQARRICVASYPLSDSDEKFLCELCGRCFSSRSPQDGDALRFQGHTQDQSDRALATSRPAPSDADPPPHLRD